VAIAKSCFIEKYYHSFTVYILAQECNNECWREHTLLHIISSFPSFIQID